jgi:hypothetical protein
MYQFFTVWAWMSPIPDASISFRVHKLVRSQCVGLLDNLFAEYVCDSIPTPS